MDQPLNQLLKKLENYKYVYHFLWDWQSSLQVPVTVKTLAKHQLHRKLAKHHLLKELTKYQLVKVVPSLKDAGKYWSPNETYDYTVNRYWQNRLRLLCKIHKIRLKRHTKPFTFGDTDEAVKTGTHTDGVVKSGTHTDGVVKSGTHTDGAVKTGTPYRRGSEDRNPIQTGQWRYAPHTDGAVKTCTPYRRGSGDKCSIHHATEESSENVTKPSTPKIETLHPNSRHASDQDTSPVKKITPPTHLKNDRTRTNARRYINSIDR